MRLIKTVSKDKLRGGFYTPAPIADFVTKWALNGSNDLEILEPSCGDGNFLKAILRSKKKFKRLDAVELLDEEAKKSASIPLEGLNVINSDYYEFYEKNKTQYDVILGNPPYIRYQYFDAEQKRRAEAIFTDAGLKYSKLTNAWVSFVVGSSLMLKKDSGKIGFVLPAEILQVSYAKALRKFLAEHFNKVTLVSFESLVFPEVQQEVVIVLCEKDGSGKHNIDHIEAESVEQLMDIDMSRIKNPTKRIDFHSNKWTFYFLEQNEIDFIEKLQESKIIPKLSDYADVEVGITTGANPFFTVTEKTVEEYSLRDYSRPLVGRSVQVPGAIFDKSDWEANRRNQARTHLLAFPTIKEIKSNKLAYSYILNGEKDDIHTGYKNRIRDEWQIVPSLRTSEALFIRRNNQYPKLILNRANAYTTDTMHRVFIKKGVVPESLIASYYNSLTLAFTEISGRSHGGGVLELMPSEAESILIPYVDSANSLLRDIDRKIRSLKDLDSILEVNDKYLLADAYGLTEEDIRTAKNIWIKLRNRRLRRGKKNLS